MTTEHQHIKTLLDKALVQQLSPAELRELLEVAGDDQRKEAFIAAMEKQFGDFRPEATEDLEYWEESKRIAYANLFPRPQVHRVHFLRTSWFRYAAAVVLVAGGAITYFISGNSEKSQPIANDNKRQQTDILPGSNRAVLTLADGSQIVLDNAANGNLAQQGNTKVIKLDNGQLAYNAGSALSKELLYNTISTPKGGQYQIVLPDGSKVWLNAASSIRFPAAFSGTGRNVEVTGEVYMEIVQRSKQPFIVKANGTEVMVLGTSFNINAYPEEASIKTTLIEGSVKINAAAVRAGYAAATPRNDAGVILKPGQQAVVAESGDAIKVSDNADIEKTLAWKNGLFNFNGASLRNVMSQLERWYDIKVQYEGKPSEIIFKGKMYRNVNLSDVLEVLQQMGVQFRLEGKTLVVL